MKPRKPASVAHANSSAAVAIVLRTRLRRWKSVHIATVSAITDKISSSGEKRISSPPIFGSARQLRRGAPILRQFHVARLEPDPKQLRQRRALVDCRSDSRRQHVIVAFA